MSASDAPLVFRGATVGWGSNRVVREAELVVGAGEVVGLIGPNGAGKSTLLRAVTAEAAVLAGSIEVAGASVADLAARDRAMLVGVVPQQVTAAFAISAWDFVEMGRHPHLGRFDRPGAHDRAVIEEAMSRTDTMRLAKRRTDELSGGDLQRLALAQALAQEPRVLLLDEPVSHLDLNHRLQVLDLVDELAAGGLAVLAVFHELDLAARYADRIAVVDRGRLSAAAPPPDVLTVETLRETFEVRAVVGIDPVTGAVAVTPVLRDEAVGSGGRGRVFVVAGSGSGAGLMRRLSADGWAISAAPLNAGDLDAGVADALGVEYERLAPFGAVDDEAAGRALALARQADAVLVADVPFGGANLPNLHVAVASGRPVIVVGKLEGRDYAGGRADELLAAALDAGATQAASVDAALVELGRIAGSARGDAGDTG